MKKPPKPAAIGIDCPVDKINISFIDIAGKEIKKENLKTGNKNKLPETLETVLKALNSDIPIMAAISEEDEEKHLNRLPRNLDIISRPEALYSASLGKKTGILLEADFESKTFFIDENGNFRNFKTKDEDWQKGSSCQIAKYYAMFNAEAAKKGTISAKEIIKKAMNNDLRAAEIIDFAQADLCNLLLKTIINTCGIKENINVALAGNLIENEFFRSSLIRKIKASIKTCRATCDVKIYLPIRSIEFECARLALIRQQGK